MKSVNSIVILIIGIVIGVLLSWGLKHEHQPCEPRANFGGEDDFKSASLSSSPLIKPIETNSLYSRRTNTDVSPLYDAKLADQYNKTGVYGVFDYKKHFELHPRKTKLSFDRWKLYGQHRKSSYLYSQRMREHAENLAPLALQLVRSIHSNAATLFTIHANHQQ
jgi:hypothetical protein